MCKINDFFCVIFIVSIAFEQKKNNKKMQGIKQFSFNESIKRI